MNEFETGGTMSCRIVVSLVIAALFLMSSFAANAGLITSLSGDKDCFGLGGTCTDGE